MEWILKKRIWSTVAVFAFVVTGTYNAIVISSESNINGADVRFVKRLDELKGIVEPGRLVATGVQWQKLESISPKPILNNQLVSQEIKTLASASVSPNPENESTAAVSEELNLTLAEVINPKKWPNGLTSSQFSGSLSTANGSIENLSASLPEGDGLSVSFAEMSGNVFEYDMAGEVYSGMLYQVDQSSYMVTLSNGPLEGTRLRFVAEPNEEQVAESQQALLGNSELDGFGNPGDMPEVAPTPEPMVQNEMMDSPQLEAPEEQQLVFNEEEIPQENG